MVFQFCEKYGISDAANNFDLKTDLNELRKNIELMIENDSNKSISPV